MSTFDLVSHDFEVYRALPAGIPLRIRDAVWEEVRTGPTPILLDLGAGTGRVGEVFVDNNDHYVGVDLSAEMLQRFGSKVRQAGQPFPRFVQADGRSLPFADGQFDAVLLVHVVSNVPGWRYLVDESRRVLHPEGVLIVGQVTRPIDGLDAQMNAQLDLIAEGLGMPPRRSKTQKHDARRELEALAKSYANRRVATWTVNRTPGSFLERKPTGGRFAALAPELRDQALGMLATWAVSTFGSLDAPMIEEHAFVCDIYRF